MLGTKVFDCHAHSRLWRPLVSDILAPLVLNPGMHAGTPGQYWRTLEEVEAEGSNPVGRDAPSPWVHLSLHAFPRMLCSCPLFQQLVS